MERCTVTGREGTHALPFQPMNKLKAKMFKLLPRYHTAPKQFEPVWKKCVVGIEQACGRLRRDKKRQLCKLTLHTIHLYYYCTGIYINNIVNLQICDMLFCLSSTAVILPGIIAEIDLSAMKERCTCPETSRRYHEIDNSSVRAVECSRRSQYYRARFLRW